VNDRVININDKPTSNTNPLLNHRTNMKLFHTLLVIDSAAASLNAEHVGQGEKHNSSNQSIALTYVQMTGTFFHPAIGACGKANTDADHIVAVSAALFDNFPGATKNPNNNPICGKEITIKCGLKPQPRNLS
jgi:uncharacterized low-complexity protein